MSEVSTIRTEQDLLDALRSSIEEGEIQEAIADHAVRMDDFTYYLTRDKGMVLKLDNGAEFQLTIKRSEPPTSRNADDPEDCPHCDDVLDAFGNCKNKKCGYSKADYEEEEDTDDD